MASFRLLVLNFVCDYIENWGGSPSYGEIAAGTERSRKTVKHAVLSLVGEGLLLRRPGPRGLSLPDHQQAAVRQLRDLGWTIDEDLQVAIPDADGAPHSPLLPPAELDYVGDLAMGGDETDGKTQGAGADQERN